VSQGTRQINSAGVCEGLRAETQKANWKQAWPPSCHIAVTKTQLPQLCFRTFQRVGQRKAIGSLQLRVKLIPKEPQG
jgi:hypothetical protein